MHRSASQNSLNEHPPLDDERAIDQQVLHSRRDALLLERRPVEDAGGIEHVLL